MNTAKNTARTTPNTFWRSSRPGMKEYQWATYVDWGLRESQDYKAFTREVRRVSGLEDRGIDR
jgi:hypothetical protein